MSRTTAIALVVLSVGAAAGVVWRWLTVLPYPMGGGQFEVSPDGKLEAHAPDLTDKAFWGGERHYYEFEVCRKGASGTLAPVRTVRMPAPRWPKATVAACGGQSGCCGRGDRPGGQ